jgi:hypothetical protein
MEDILRWFEIVVNLLNPLCEFKEKHFVVVDFPFSTYYLAFEGQIKGWIPSTSSSGRLDTNNTMWCLHTTLRKCHLAKPCQQNDKRITSVNFWGLCILAISTIRSVFGMTTLCIEHLTWNSGRDKTRTARNNVSQQWGRLSWSEWACCPRELMTRNISFERCPIAFSKSSNAPKR